MNLPWTRLAVTRTAINCQSLDMFEWCHQNISSYVPGKYERKEESWGQGTINLHSGSSNFFLIKYLLLQSKPWLTYLHLYEKRSITISTMSSCKSGSSQKQTTCCERNQTMAPDLKRVSSFSKWNPFK